MTDNPTDPTAALKRATLRFAAVPDKTPDVDEFYTDTALPYHYLDEDRGQQRGPCPHSGGIRNSLGGCPRGCSGATEHYANDGHRGCAERTLTGIAAGPAYTSAS